MIDTTVSASEDALGSIRVSQLLGQAVHGRGGHPGGHVSDLRLDVTGGADALPVLGLVINAGPIRFLFGPERRAEHRPWLVQRLVRGRRRHTTGYLAWDDVGDVDWDTRRVRHAEERLSTFEP